MDNCSQRLCGPGSSSCQSGSANTVLADLGTARCSSFCYREDLSPSHSITPCSWEAPGAQQCQWNRRTGCCADAPDEGIYPAVPSRPLRWGFATKVCNSMGQVSEKRWLNGSLLDLPHIRAVTLYGFHSLSSIILTFSWHGVTLALRESKRNWSTWTPDLILSCRSVSLPSTCPLVSTMPESFDPWNWHHSGYGAVQTEVWGGSGLSAVNFSALGCSSVEWGRDLVGQQFGVSLRERCRSAQESTTCSTKSQHAGLAPEVHSKFKRLRCLAQKNRAGMLAENL